MILVKLLDVAGVAANIFVSKLFPHAIVFLWFDLI